MLQLIAKETGINVPIDNKNSGQSVSQVIAEAKNPVADAMYLGISFAINAKKAGIIEPFKGKGWQSVPDNLKDPDGYWVSIHAGTVGFMVNKEALGDVPVPKSWKDLLDPKYDGMVGFLDPSSAFVGYACAVAANQALGGSLDNFKPGIEFYKKLLETTRSFRSRRHTLAACPVKFRFCLTMTSMPIEPNTPTRRQLSLSSPRKARFRFRT